MKSETWCIGQKNSAPETFNILLKNKMENLRWNTKSEFEEAFQNILNKHYHFKQALSKQKF